MSLKMPGDRELQKQRKKSAKPKKLELGCDGAQCWSADSVCSPKHHHHCRGDGETRGIQASETVANPPSALVL